MANPTYSHIGNDKSDGIDQALDWVNTHVFWDNPQLFSQCLLGVTDLNAMDYIMIQKADGTGLRVATIADVLGVVP